VVRQNEFAFSINITVDENGNGLFTNTAGFSRTLPFALQADPLPGGFTALTYSLLNPPGLTVGDLVIEEPGASFPGDVVRFNPDETCADGTKGCLVFYSEMPVDSLADTGLPRIFFPVVTEDLGQVIYTPTAGQPGFVAGAAGPVTYDIISDPVPEPTTLALLGSGLFGLVMRRRRGRVLGSRFGAMPVQSRNALQPLLAWRPMIGRNRGLPLLARNLL
jgi:hypothetical protein